MESASDSVVSSSIAPSKAKVTKCFCSKRGEQGEEYYESEAEKLDERNVVGYFEPIVFKVRSNPLRKERRSKNKHFRVTSNENEYYQVEALKDRKLSIEVSLGNGLGVRFRIRENKHNGPNYICSCVSRKIYGHKHKSALVRSTLVNYVVDNWDKFRGLIKDAYMGSVAFFRHYQLDDPKVKVQKEAQNLYRSIHNDRFFDIKLFEVGALCEIMQMNHTIIINSLDGDFHVFKPTTNFDRHIFILATECRDYEIQGAIDHSLTWLDFIKTSNTTSNDKFLPNCILYMTHSNASISYYHLLEYDNYLSQISKEFARDCKNTREFKRLPKIRNQRKRPTQMFNEETEQMRRNTGHIWFSRTKKVIVYWRPKRKGVKLGIRNRFRRFVRTIKEIRCLPRKKNLDFMSQSPLLLMETGAGGVQRMSIQSRKPRDSIFMSAFNTLGRNSGNSDTLVASLF